MSVIQRDGQKAALPRNTPGEELRELTEYAEKADARRLRGLGWLFLHRVLDVPQNTIAAAYGRDRSDVSRSIAAASGDLRATLTPPQRCASHTFSHADGI